MKSVRDQKLLPEVNANNRQTLINGMIEKYKRYDWASRSYEEENYCNLYNLFIFVNKTVCPTAKPVAGTVADNIKFK